MSTPRKTRISSRWTSVATAACLSAASLAGTAFAAESDWPTKPIRLVVPSAPGGGGDTVARIWANCAATRLGQPVVVENKGGANGIPGVQTLKQAPADGYTLFVAGMSQMTITPYIFKQPPYDAVADFDGASLLVSSPYLLIASPASGIESFAQIAAAGKASAQGLNFGSPGSGSPAHLMSAILADALKVDLTHVPFQGEAAALTSLTGGQIDLAPFIAGTALPHVKSGKLKALAVLGETRLAELPDVPTIQEVMGTDDLAHGSWTAIITRKGAPAAVIEKVHAVTQACLKDEEVIRRYDVMNAAPILAPIEDVAAYTERDTNLWKPLVERLGLRND